MKAYLTIVNRARLSYYKELEIRLNKLFNEKGGLLINPKITIFYCYLYQY